MKLINQALSEKNLKLKNLPQDLQSDIAEHKELIIRYNMACEEYEKQEEEDHEVEQKLDAQEDVIANNEIEIAQKIKSFVPEEPAPAPADPAPITEPVVPVEKEEKSSIGWLIFGGAALLITLGAVNVFKKK